MPAPNPICFALDVPSLEEAQSLVDRLGANVGAFKVGLELYISGGMPVTRRHMDFDIPTVLDLKLYDIPETVARAVKAGGNRGAKFMTMHIQQRATLEAALKAAEEFKDLRLLGVTVLTSMTSQDCRDLMLHASDEDPSDTSPGTRAENLAKFAYEIGLRGFVCSPQEVKALKTACPEAFFLVPGVRPAGSATGDQKRVGTPLQAVQDGANLIVIGRPIRDAKDPVEAAKAIFNEVLQGLVDSVPVV